MALSENKPEKLLSSWDPGYSSVHAAEAAGSLFIAVVGGPRDRPALQPGMGLDRFSEEQVRKNDSNLYHVPDLAMALGMGKSNGKPALILVYAHANKADAQLHASRFAKLIERGTSTNQLTPWKDKFHRSRIESRGKLMIAVLETDHPSYGFESLATNDNLV
jgi:hypothetical protein